MKLFIALGIACLAGCAQLAEMDRSYRASKDPQREAQFQREQADLARAMVMRPSQVAPPSVSTQRAGQTAYWTGKSQAAQSVTGAVGFNCEFNFAGRTFWRMFQTCPSSIQIQ